MHIYILFSVNPDKWMALLFFSVNYFYIQSSNHIVNFCYREEKININILFPLPCLCLMHFFPSTIATRSLERLLWKAPFQDKCQFTDNDFY